MKQAVFRGWPTMVLVAIAALVPGGSSCLSSGQKTEFPVATAPLATPLLRTLLPPVSPAPTGLATQTVQPPPAAAASRTVSLPPAGPVIDPDPQAGEKTFYAVGCIGCHTVQGVGGRVGPELTDIARRKDSGYIRESIRTPGAFVVPGYPAVMPSPEGFGLSDQDIDNVVVWLRSMK